MVGMTGLPSPLLVAVEDPAVLLVFGVALALLTWRSM